MDTELNSPPHDSGETIAAFRKPSNDGSGRKYRRRDLADNGSSSSDGSPERNQSPSTKHSKGDIRNVSEPGHARKDDRRESDRSRYGRGVGDSHRHDRYSRDVKHDDHNRHERDASRSSRDSRGGRHSDRRRVETEHSRSRNDSRDKYSNARRRNNSIDEEKDYVRGRESQDEKRGSRWGFGDRHSRDERKERADPENNKEKDVHVKSPRDRSDGKCLAIEDRDTHSKKLKGFISEKFTHGNINAEEKQTSSLKPTSGSGNQGLTLQSHSKEAQVSGDVDAAKVAAMQAAELVNKNLVGTGYLTTDQKKKLLWGKKKSTATEEPAHRWDSALIGDRERQEKFNKLMSLRLRWCIIVGCEREYSKTRAEPKRSRLGEAERVAAGTREAVHCGVKEERRTHSRVRSLMNLFGKLFSYSPCLFPFLFLFLFLYHYMRSLLVASPFCTLLLLLPKSLFTINSCVCMKLSLANHVFETA